MNNIDSIPNLIMLLAFLAVSFWGTYKLTHPYKSDSDKKKVKCSK